MTHSQVSCSHCSLDSLCLPRGLSQSEINDISKVVKAHKTLQRGDFIYHEGDRFRGILAIKSGSAKLVANDAHGNEHIISILLPGELLGFDGLSTEHHGCAAIALETMMFCILPADSLEHLFQTLPGLTRELFRHTGEKFLEDRNQRVLSKRPAEERLAYFLISLSERLHRRGFSASEFKLSLTRQEIGNHLGLALETVSRLLKKFQDDGLIGVRHRFITLRNPSALRNILQARE
ncbi:MAG: helix-turn-helix domain-containing protein [Methylomonas sp.]|nr:helix-turn-helix domain-containing protein [Methylomonas sp.]PPD21579.1 MAG: Crp/Fnr family transcriptional regulator [Methylomonas sp.]PPD26371.1 MAG: Crp/Fnr family transcriptional regulator [Methylomonas sp.]PPD38111.1 MAG: Crp/Fnr family transcriptional regulator [Methylomonas sp.]PPD53383.1 MAG: Crp/Fnr family transcriptional regulator [Methylomonas sp.]